MTVERIGVSLEPELLAQFDALIEERGYASRSQAIRDLVRQALVRRRWERGDETVVATVTLVYRHTAGGVTRRIVDEQHEHFHDIKSANHTHLTRDLCLEVLIVEGRARKIAQLADRLKSIRGVLHAELVMTSLDLT